MNVVLHPLARFLLALIFIMSGFNKIMGFAKTSNYMASYNFPVPDLFLVGAIFLQLGGGLLLLFGFKARVGAILLIIFLVPATLIFHVSALPDQRQMIVTLKNLAILGGLLKFLSDGAGAFAIDKNDE